MILNKKALIIASLIIGVNTSQAQTANTANEPGINLGFMDKSVKPNDDFFRFVNGKWLLKTEIPNDRSRWGSFDELRKKTDIDAMAILKAASKNAKYNSNTDQ